MKRKIIEINEEKCTGCGQCIPNCAEGALQIIDGKARLISDLFCDGLGACIGTCPEKAISITEREAEEYDEVKVLKERILPAGPNTLKEHLQHLKSHGADEYHKQAITYLHQQGIQIPLDAPEPSPHHQHGSCPGSRAQSIERIPDKTVSTDGSIPLSELSHWPVQLHLINPLSPHFKEADLLIAADCVAFSRGDFHSRFLRGKKLVIACPKLDADQDMYLGKLTTMVEQSQINSITVMRMEVPCCGGIVSLAKKAVGLSSRSIPIKEVVIGIDGRISSEHWSLE